MAPEIIARQGYGTEVCKCDVCVQVCCVVCVLTLSMCDDAMLHNTVVVTGGHLVSSYHGHRDGGWGTSIF